mgnify:CR=1 FL=1
MSHPDTTREYGIDESPLIPDPDTQEQDECSCLMKDWKILEGSSWQVTDVPSRNHGEECPMYIP